LKKIRQGEKKEKKGKKKSYRQLPTKEGKSLSLQYP